MVKMDDGRSSSFSIYRGGKLGYKLSSDLFNLYGEYMKSGNRELEWLNIARGCKDIKPKNTTLLAARQEEMEEVEWRKKVVGAVSKSMTETNMIIDLLNS